GFEIKITESLAKGVLVVAYASGGIPHQIIHGKTGYLIDKAVTKSRCSSVANHLHALLTDGELYEKMSLTARESVDEEFFTVYQL
ncbi:hypothetical protein BJ742DRAFT_670825, partial [Cladochytrium replicatum]